MKTKRFGTVAWLGLAGMLGTITAPGEAQACGGFFCSANQPVNQAAERIVFADNGDGTVTAVIQILYQGAAPKFSWLLPISTVPTGDNIAVASNLAFQRLQTATNPQYNLTTRVEGSCKPTPPSQGLGGAASSPSGGGVLVGGTAGNGGVVVEASGTVGSFDWSVISVDSSLADPATVAVKWLEDNGYTVGDGTPGLVRPYLTDGLFLLALKLTKGADTGSIRPIVLTYEAARPMIPIKLTAVAANDDMGVMAWLLSSARGVPQNYLSLELNEAKINWFNANSNYNAVVTAAADEAGGQGFVTEFAGANPMSGVLWSPQDESQWQTFQSRSYATFEQAFTASYSTWGAWDGFWDAVRSVVTLTAPLTLTEFQKCPSCYPGQVQFASGVTSASYVEALKTQVTDPVKDLQTLFDAHAYVTRLYTTMSAAEMSVDPLFTFNSSLPELSNVHRAERVIECRPELYQTEAPWRIELGQGVVRGTGSQAQSRVWPAFDSQPANSRIVRLAATGPGLVLEDNGQVISDALDAYAATLPSNGGSGGVAVGGSGGVAVGGSGGAAVGGSGGAAVSGGSGNSGGTVTSTGGAVIAGGGAGGAGGSQSSGSCSLALDGEASPWALPALAALAGALRRRRSKSPS